MLWKVQEEPLKTDPHLCVLSGFLPHDICQGRNSSRWLPANSDTVSTVSPSISLELIGSDAEYIMRNTGLEETQAGIKIVRRNINNPRYADDTTLMAESEEELKSLLMKGKRRVKKLA